MSPSHHRIQPILLYIYTHEKRQPANDCLCKYSFDCCVRWFLYSFPPTAEPARLSCVPIYALGRAYVMVGNAGFEPAKL